MGNITYTTPGRLSGKSKEEVFRSDSSNIAIKKGYVPKGKPFIISKEGDIIVRDMTSPNVEKALSVFHNGARITIVQLGDYISA